MMDIARQLADLMSPEDHYAECADYYVWCDLHGCIHEKTRDPYRYGEPECGEPGAEHWREVIIGEPL